MNVIYELSFKFAIPAANIHTAIPRFPHTRRNFLLYLNNKTAPTKVNKKFTLPIMTFMFGSIGWPGLFKTVDEY